MARATTCRVLTKFFAIGVLCCGSATYATAAEKLRVLIIDGQNNHDWRKSTPPMKADLEQSGRFDVTVATTPEAKAPESAWASFRPDFSKYDVVLSNYNGEAWPKPVQKAIEEYVAGGGGLVIVHAANNSFPEWPAYNEMIGLGWRDAGFGDRITVDDSGKVVRTPKGEGPGSGHGPQHPYTVVVRKPDHPITKGLPAEWLHVKDELYHGQRGPAKNMEVLATAYSDKDKGGTGTNEPMVWVIPFGKGRVFTNVMGHVMGDDLQAVKCADYRTLLLRGAEWAATGAVTIPVPKDFPTTGK